MIHVFHSFRRAVSVSILALTFVAAGCASQPSGGASEQTRVITTHQGAFFVQGPHVTGYPIPGKTLCPDCTKAAQGFALTGKIDPVCPSCNSPRTVTTHLPRP